ncbi:hypothetical protein [Terrimonas alba]|uniref:hypothetical protein n=1 Tax=Terrimonas alba TaxID=3349636 RepID=UPI0035F2EDF2
MSTIRSQKIPAQHHGEEADIIETVQAATEEDARQIFRAARQRLFDVSHWENISKGISASFVLTDQSGRPKQGVPAPGDHFRINIPGPGSAAGSGYDWVKVELVEDNSDAASPSESALIKVRPAEDPVKQEGIAHFLDKEATSSFIVKRENKLVTAAVHGRNEKPNTAAEKITDKIRNAVVGTAAVKGIAKIQWQKLVTGLLNIR